MLAGTISFFYLFISPKLFLHWIKALANLLPLFLAITIFALIGKDNFYTTLYLIGRLCLILLLSIYLIKSTPEHLVFDFLPEKWVNARQYLTATFLFIPIFINSINTQKGHTKDPWKILTNALQKVKIEISSVREQVISQKEIHLLKFSWKADLAALALLLINTTIAIY